MYYSSEMDWNSKWGWENLEMFNSKGSDQSLKKLHLTDWEVEDEPGGSLKMSGCDNGGSDSELLHGYSMKSSISFGHSPGNIIKSETEQYTADSSVSVEPLLGLKLGKRTYFENNSNIINNINSPALKKTKGSFQNRVIPRCQVLGCNLDLSSAKDYHRKHRVCDKHSKSPNVIVGGMQLRFCQQCSRFHSLSDFDEKKRSCRRRLSDHNARRRKPKQETLHQFHSTKLYDDMGQMKFEMDNNDNGGSSNMGNLDKSFPWRFEKSGHVSTQGSKEGMLSFNSNGGEPELPGGALSLLSSTEAVCIIMSSANHVTTATLPPTIHEAIPQSDFWQVDQQSNNFHLNNFGNHFGQVQYFRS